jgi:membrane-associated protease RseP (regulator of RpoE activity)
VKTLIVWTMVVVCALVPQRAARAQASASGRASTAWSTSISYLGIENIRCDCTVRAGSDRDRLFIFRTAPVVTGVAPGSAGDGILFRGDTITTIDGYSLLTPEGARRFATIAPGDDVNLLVKRGGNLLKLSLRASSTHRPRAYTDLSPEAPGGFITTWEYPPTTPQPATPPAMVAPAPRGAARATPPRGVAEVWAGVAAGAPAARVSVTAPPSPVATPRAPLTPPVVPGEYAPRGWFGFSIRCNGCGWAVTGRPGASPVWESEDAPELSMVEAESPAGRAGLRTGDRITHIDGLSILTRAGAERFGAVRPGQRVRLTVLRNGSSITRELTLARRPEVRAAIAAAAVEGVTPRAATRPAMRRELRYTGQLDNVTVEVWSAGGPSVEKVGDTMVITIGTSVVRLKVDPKKAP